MAIFDKVKELPLGTIMKSIGGVFVGAAALGIVLANSIDDDYSELMEPDLYELEDNSIEIDPISVETVIE